MAWEERRLFRRNSAGQPVLEGWGEGEKIGKENRKTEVSLSLFTSRGRGAKSKDRQDPVKLKFLV